MCIRDSVILLALQHALDGIKCVLAADLELAIFVFLMLGTACLLYTSDAADERSSVDLGGRRIIKKKKT